MSECAKDRFSAAKYLAARFNELDRGFELFRRDLRKLARNLV
jgi:hypothetical protein